MAFVIDASEWDFNGMNAHDVEVVFMSLLERLRAAAERNERVWVGDDLQTRQVLGTLSFWDLFSLDSPLVLSRSLREQMSAHLGRASRYLDENEWPPGMSEIAIAIDDSPSADNIDVAWAHHCVRNRRAIACLGLNRVGIHLTTSALGAAQVHWVGDETGHRAFFRAAIDIERDSETSLAKFGAHAYPDICFLAGVWDGLYRFHGGYGQVRLKLRALFDTLDASGSWMFTAPPPAELESDAKGASGVPPGNQLLERRFALRGFDAAPEKPDVLDTPNCLAARQRNLGARTLYLEWHVKLEPRWNRVHMHAPVAESRGRVVVGIVDKHLPLPGD